MAIKLSYESCVRTRSVFSECSKCIDSCSYDAIAQIQNSVRINLDGCVECAACVGACPTSAIETFSFEAFIDRFLSSSDTAIDCKKDGICAASFGADELFFLLALSKKDILVELGYCDGCKSAALKETIEERIKEANALCGYYGLSQKAFANYSALLEDSKENSVDSSKRSLFGLFTKEGVKKAGDKLKSDEEFASEKETTIDYALLKTKKLPFKRELFLKIAEKLESIGKEWGRGLSFAADKHIDETCDNCSLCYSLCPSEALQVTQMKNAILFSPHLCLRCALCEEVCEKKSISSLPAFDPSVFKTKSKKVLIKFKARLCESCGAVFSTEGSECPRCSAESEGARELLGL